MNNLADRLIIFLMFIPIVSVHEAAHAWAAHLLGDDTARDEGRLTLNPLSHIDLWGTIALPALILFTSSGMPLGWGRPVPVTGSNLAHWRRDEIVIALAGPLANLALVVAAVGIAAALGPASVFRPLCITFACAAAFLGIFNLLPIPLFDGWTVVRTLFDIPGEWEIRASPWIMVAVFVVFFFTPLAAYMDLASRFIVAACAAPLGGL